ncbi:EEF1A lysine methyltransferase 2-like [Ornithodoros turicata]|uniref:EEF1A lysine methyltransferase 2-like n=1 Tax=Ornithodoros turicata TaxID=34597 RepID=UPI0031393DF3
MDNNTEEECLGPSTLGTKEYWEATYIQELQNYSEHGDVGEVWFGEDSERRLLSWLESNSDKHASILELGCGNGHLLHLLATKGYANLTGVDYVPQAVALAKEAAPKGSSVVFEVGDILGPSERCLAHQYDIVLDKGTYDAISLSPKDPTTKRAKYKNTLLRLLKPKGHFLITSCNWTQQELELFFAPLQIVALLPARTMVFQGKSGSTTTSLVFAR